jgi:RHS repeat-associated protein
VTASFGYSADRLQLTSLAYTQGTNTLFSLSYGYGAAGSDNGQIQTVTDNVDAGRSIAYTYGNLARLASAVTSGDSNYPQWGLSFSYDRYGNRTNQTVTAGSAPSNSVTVDQTTNRISQSPYAYDADGNMTNDGQNNSMVYDAENRLVSINAGSATYSYDAKSLRVKKVAGRTTTVYIFSGTKVVAEYENGAAPNAPTRECIYSGGALLAKIEGGATTYYHTDQLSIRMATDSSGNVVGQQGHYPFGEAWYQNNTTTKWLFTSYERDAESGNDYAVFRYNVNRLGRFASPDPLGGSPSDPQSLDRYAYVLNDPVNLVDPLGLIGVEACTVEDMIAGICTSSNAEWVIGLGPNLAFGGGAPNHGGGGGVGDGDCTWGVSPSGVWVNCPQPQKPQTTPSSTKKTAFINANLSAASQVAFQLNVPAANILGLAAEETGYGTSSIALNAHNFFGIHAGAPGNIGTYTTAGGATVSMFPAGTGFLSSAQSFAANFGSLVNGISNPTAFARALVPKFNSANAATGGNPNFVRLVGGTIKGVSACLH